MRKEKGGGRREEDLRYLYSAVSTGVVDVVDNEMSAF